MCRFSAQVLFTLAVSLFASATSPADLILDLQYTDTTTSKTVASGTSVFVDLLLTDTDASTLMTAEGLLTGGGRLVQTAGTITLTPGTITANPGWDAGSVTTSPSSSGPGPEIAKFLASADFLAPGGVGKGLTSIVIATFELVATGAGGSTATLTADILNAVATLSTFDTLEDLDVVPPTYGSVDLTISAAAVPEPATVVLGSLSLCVAGAGVWRRRRAARRNANAPA